MLGELLIEERVVRAPELDRIAVVAQLTEQEQLGFFGEGIPQGDVIIGEILLVRIGFAQLVEFQPRKKEPRDEGLGAIVGQHSADVALERRGIAQAVALRILQ